jgi:uncharacterized membrane protein YqjE
MSSPEAGPKSAATRLASAVVALVHTRVELASLELAEERERFKQSIALLAAAVVLLAFAAVTATLGIIALFWDTNRYTAIAVVTVVYAMLGLLALWRRNALRRDAAPPFAATLDALRKDGEWLTRRTHGESPPAS